jgi:ABC-type antimicrobial peptide transport system permease subunit
LEAGRRRHVSGDRCRAVGDGVRRQPVIDLYAQTNHWNTVIPTTAWAGGIGAAPLIGATAGLLPALRAARMSPTQALWTV